MRVVGVKQAVPFYTLDVIISVGYRVKSKRGRGGSVAGPIPVLKEYIIKGYAVNHNRMNQLNEVIQVMKRVESSLDSKQVLTVVERIQPCAWNLLDALRSSEYGRGPKEVKPSIRERLAQNVAKIQREEAERRKLNKGESRSSDLEI